MTVSAKPSVSAQVVPILKVGTVPEYVPIVLAFCVGAVFGRNMYAPRLFDIYTNDQKLMSEMPWHAVTWAYCTFINRYQHREDLDRFIYVEVGR